MGKVMIKTVICPDCGGHINRSDFKKHRIACKECKAIRDYMG